jgi:hypothetical protein
VFGLIGQRRVDGRAGLEFPQRIEQRRITMAGELRDSYLSSPASRCGTG